MPSFPEPGSTELEAVPSPPSSEGADLPFRGESRSNDTISFWVRELQTGNRAAASVLWERYKIPLTQFGRSLLDSRVRRTFDENDFASVSFHRFLQVLERGTTREIQSREQAWRLLSKIAKNLMLDEVDAQQAQKRGGGKIHGDSLFFSREWGQEEGLWGTAIEESCLIDTEEFHQFLDGLGDATLKAIALALFQGVPKAVIASSSSVSVRTVERKLVLLKRLWDSRSEHSELEISSDTKNFGSKSAA